MAAQKKYKSIARLYDILDMPFEYRRYRPIRRELWAGLSGRILDAGVGTGRNMEFYPADALVTGLDYSPDMLGRARARRDRLGRSVDLIECDITHAAFAENSFDVIVATFLFCVLDDELQRPALAELGRVCRPGGEIHILEYSLSKDPFRKFMMKLWAPWVRFAYGASFDRNTEQYAAAAGLELVSSRFLFMDIIKLLVMRPA